MIWLTYKCFKLNINDDLCVKITHKVLSFEIKSIFCVKFTHKAVELLLNTSIEDNYTVFDDNETFNEIMNAKTPFEYKKYGRKVEDLTQPFGTKRNLI